METDYVIRKRVTEMGEDGIPLADIVKMTGKPRPTVERWLTSEGIEPVMKRGQPVTKRKGSLRGSPVALRIEEGVAKRLEEMRRQEEAEGRREAA